MRPTVGRPAPCSVRERERPFTRDLVTGVDLSARHGHAHSTAMSSTAAVTADGAYMVRPPMVVAVETAALDLLIAAGVMRTAPAHLRPRHQPVSLAGH